MCAKESWADQRNCYADTLSCWFWLDKEADSVKQVDQPEAFGVVKLNANNEIVRIIENQRLCFRFSGYRFTI
jgi:glucose-1-phosphate thymidylyltransferase